jgi:exodeoxyribonuclease VII small subunit
MADPQPSFEQALQELEDVIAHLEAGGATLDETMALYERGQKLVALCGAALDGAELRLEQLKPGGEGGTVAAPFDQGEA